MFRPDDLLERLRRKPFQPLRIVANEGLSYDISHPELVLVGLRSVTIGFAAKNRPGVYDRPMQLALVHVVGMEELAPDASEPPAISPADTAA